MPPAVADGLSFDATEEPGGLSKQHRTRRNRMLEEWEPEQQAKAQTADDVPRASVGTKTPVASMPVGNHTTASRNRKGLPSPPAAALAPGAAVQCRRTAPPSKPDPRQTAGEPSTREKH